MSTYSQSSMEKMANNLFTIILARGAMIITPFLLWFFWETMNNRIETLEVTSAIYQKQITDHEQRLVVGKTQREEFQRQAVEQFSNINNSLKETQIQLGVINGNIIRLQTTLERNATK